MAAYSYNQYQFNNRGNPANPEQDQVALFIDWDNLVISNYADRGGNRPDLEVLVRRAQQYGTVVIARAYAEWNITADRLEVYKAGIEPIYAPVFHADRDLSGQTSRGKSLADPVMVTDCIDFLHLLPQIGTYVLVTGDKDMVPVVRLARLRGRRVVIIGPDYVANVLQQVSDEFIPYRFLLSQVVPVDPYAAYYQQQQGQAAGQPAYYPPGQPPLPQGYYPPQMAQPQQQPQQATSGTDRRGRRLTNRRGQSNYPTPPIQPYARIVAPPPTGQPQQPGYPPNYGVPAQAYPQAQPELYQQPGVSPAPGYQAPGYQAPGQPTGYPVAQPQPATPAGQPDLTSQTGRPAYTAQPQAQPVYQPAPAAAPISAPAAIPAPETVANAGAPKNGQGDFNEVKEAIRQIIAQRTAIGRGQMRARDLKEELLRRIPNFSERRYGFSKFKALLSAAEAAGVLQIDQSGHILWVSAPGTPKMQFGATEAATEETTSPADADLDEEGEDEAASPEAQADLEALDGVAAVAPEDALQTQPVVEPDEATLEGPEDEPVYEAAVVAPVAEERTTSLVEAPIGAHREKPAPRPNGDRTAAPAGNRPALLDQPYYEDVIVLIDGLRNRNRWLGYELLLSNVRDYLTRQMPESEAKVQAGAILSKLLNDGIIKMAIEVHSRGARKMTVKVAHLQDTNPAVRFALENQKALAEGAASAVAEQPVEEATYTEVDASLAQPVEGATGAQPAENYDRPEYDVPDVNYWGSHYTKQAQPDTVQDEIPAGNESESGSVEGRAEMATLAEESQPEGETHPVEASEPVHSEGYQPASYDHSPSEGAEVNGYAVQAPVEDAPGAPAEAGHEVQGAPDYAGPGEEPAPAGGFNNTVELEAGENHDQSNGYSNQPAQEHHEGQPDGYQPEGYQPVEAEDGGKQAASETLQPVAELDSEETEEAENLEGEPEEGEPEGEVVAQKVANRRPRRRRTPAPKTGGENHGNGESMRQPAEPRPRLSISKRPHRRPRTRPANS